MMAVRAPNIRRKSELLEKVALFNRKVEEHHEKQYSNPFSDVERPADYTFKKMDIHDPNYGRPVAGSKTAQRGHEASEHMRKELKVLCEVINDCGHKMRNGRTAITFGQLFMYYNAISDKCVGNLMSARKHKLVAFEGEMLYQRRDDDTVITLTKPFEELCKLPILSGAPLPAPEPPTPAPAPAPAAAPAPTAPAVVVSPVETAPSAPVAQVPSDPTPPAEPVVETCPQEPVVEQSPQEPVVEQSPQEPVVEQSPQEPVVEQSPQEPVRDPSPPIGDPSPPVAQPQDAENAPVQVQCNQVAPSAPAVEDQEEASQSADKSPSHNQTPDDAEQRHVAPSQSTDISTNETPVAVDVPLNADTNANSVDANETPSSPVTTFTDATQVQCTAPMSQASPMDQPAA